MIDLRFMDLPKIDSVMVFKPTDCDVVIKAYTFVGGKPAAIWQYYDEFGYGYAHDFATEDEWAKRKHNG